MSSYSIVNQSSVEPITIEDAKLYLRIDGDDEDDLVYAFIKASRQISENNTWLSIVPTTFRLNMDKSEVREFILINKSPITSVVGVYYKDINGYEQTLSAQNYEVDLYSNPVRLRIKVMPNMGDYMNAMSVEFEAGYTSGSYVPKPIIQAMKLIMGHLSENRQDVAVGSSINKIPMGSEYLLEPYKQPTFFI